MRIFGRRAIVLAGIVATVGCTPIPQYSGPPVGKETAILRLTFKDQSILGGVAMVTKTPGPIICGKPYPNPERVIRISRGSPLVSDINVQGATIAAGEKFLFSTMVLVDSFPACGNQQSFMPRPGGIYEIELTGKPTARMPGATVVCETKMFELRADNPSERTALAMTAEGCVAEK